MTMTKKTKEASGVDARLVQLIAGNLGVDETEIVPAARFVDDLGADSLDVVELVMMFEEEYNLEIPDEDAEKIVTVQDAENYLSGHSKKWPAA